MFSDQIEVLLNPVRMRIIQYLALHPSATSAQIATYVENVSKASLYRHIKKLIDSGLIQVASTRRVRGVQERFYALAPPQQINGSMPSGDQLHRAYEQFLLALLGDGAHYFSRADIDPLHDGISFSTSTLMLSPEEMSELGQKINTAVLDYLQNAPGPNRRPIRLSMITIPTAQGPSESDAPADHDSKETPTC